MIEIEDVNNSKSKRIENDKCTKCQLTECLFDDYWSTMGINDERLKRAHSEFEKSQKFEFRAICDGIFYEKLRESPYGFSQRACSHRALTYSSHNTTITSQVSCPLSLFLCPLPIPLFFFHLAGGHDAQVIIHWHSSS